MKDARAALRYVDVEARRHDRAVRNSTVHRYRDRAVVVAISYAAAGPIEALEPEVYPPAHRLSGAAPGGLNAVGSALDGGPPRSGAFEVPRRDAGLAKDLY